MSGKFSKKTKNRQNKIYAKKRKKSINIIWICISILLALAALAILFLLLQTEGVGGPIPQETAAATEPSMSETEAPTEAIQIDEIEQLDLYLGNGLLVTDIGKYTGVYMEDGSDEIVSGVMMIVVTNNSTSDIQYAEITLIAEDESTATFTLSTLPVGGSVVLLEQARLAYDGTLAYTEGTAENVAVFTDALNLHEDVLKIQMYGGALNVTNISDTDITSEIVIYYKNSSSDMLYGGITYRVRIEGGLKAGELRQIMPSHFSAEGSRIMFVTVG